MVSTWEEACKSRLGFSLAAKYLESSSLSEDSSMGPSFAGVIVGPKAYRSSFDDN